MIRLREARFEDCVSLAFRGSQERPGATEALHEGLPARDVLRPAVELVRVVLADLSIGSRRKTIVRTDRPGRFRSLVMCPDIEPEPGDRKDGKLTW